MEPDLDLKPRVPQEEEGVLPMTPSKLDPTRYGDWTLGGRCIDF